MKILSRLLCRCFGHSYVHIDKHRRECSRCGVFMPVFFPPEVLRILKANMQFTRKAISK